MIISILLLVVVIIAAVVIALENPVLVQISVFGYLFQGAMGTFLLIALGIGIILGVALMLPTVIGRSIALMVHRRKLAALENPKPKPKKPSPRKKSASKKSA
ncbi:MAG: LapA family protein [Anaerolineae bacterium]|nr:MAG: LapA family protein [Anaerolineae bacterium]